MSNPTNFHQLIREHSWWHSTGTPKRTFVIGHLTTDFLNLNPLVAIYSRVGLVEYGYEDVIWVDFDEFKKNIDTGDIRPMNTLPNLHPRNEERTNA
jgi:hypothetical protein